MPGKICEFKLGGGTMEVVLNSTDDEKVEMVVTDVAGDEPITKSLVVENLPVASSVCAVLQYSENMYEDGLLNADTGVPMFVATYNFIKQSPFAGFLP